MNTANRNVTRAGHLRHGIALYRAQQRMAREQEMRLEMRDSLPPDELPDMTRDYGPQPLKRCFAVVLGLVYIAMIAAAVTWLVTGVMPV